MEHLKLQLHPAKRSSKRNPGSSLLDYEWTHDTDGVHTSISRFPLTCHPGDQLTIHCPSEPPIGAESPPTLWITFEPTANGPYTPIDLPETSELANGVKAARADNGEWVFHNHSEDPFTVSQLGPEYIFHITLANADGRLWRVDPQMNVDPPG